MGNGSSKVKSLQIVKIVPNSVSFKNKLLPFMNTIVKYNDKPIRENADIARLAFEWEEGDLKLDILDLRTELESTVVIPQKASEPLGMSVKYHEGALQLYTIHVVNVVKGSPVDKCGLVAKDYIIGVEGVSCDTENILLKYIESKKEEGVVLLVFNDKLNYIRRVEFKVQSETAFTGSEIVLGILYKVPHNVNSVDIEYDQEKIKNDVEKISKHPDKRENKAEETQLINEKEILEEDTAIIQKEVEAEELGAGDIDNIADNLSEYKEEIEKAVAETLIEDKLAEEEAVKGSNGGVGKEEGRQDVKAQTSEIKAKQDNTIVGGSSDKETTPDILEQTKAQGDHDKALSKTNTLKSEGQNSVGEGKTSEVLKHQNDRIKSDGKSFNDEHDDELNEPKFNEQSMKDRKENQGRLPDKENKSKDVLKQSSSAKNTSKEENSTDSDRLEKKDTPSQPTATKRTSNSFLGTACKEQTGEGSQNVAAHTTADVADKNAQAMKKASERSKDGNWEEMKNKQMHSDIQEQQHQKGETTLEKEQEQKVDDKQPENIDNDTAVTEEIKRGLLKSKNQKENNDIGGKNDQTLDRLSEGSKTNDNDTSNIKNIYKEPPAGKDVKPKEMGPLTGDQSIKTKPGHETLKKDAIKQSFDPTTGQQKSINRQSNEDKQVNKDKASLKSSMGEENKPKAPLQGARVDKSLSSDTKNETSKTHEPFVTNVAAKSTVHNNEINDSVSQLNSEFVGKDSKEYKNVNAKPNERPSEDGNKSQESLSKTEKIQSGPYETPSIVRKHNVNKNETNKEHVEPINDSERSLGKSYPDKKQRQDNDRSLKKEATQHDIVKPTDKTKRYHGKESNLKPSNVEPNANSEYMRYRDDVVSEKHSNDNVNAPYTGKIINNHRLDQHGLSRDINGNETTNMGHMSSTGLSIVENNSSASDRLNNVKSKPNEPGVTKQLGKNADLSQDTRKQRAENIHKLAPGLSTDQSNAKGIKKDNIISLSGLPKEQKKDYKSPYNTAITNPKSIPNLTPERLRMPSETPSHFSKLFDSRKNQIKHQGTSLSTETQKPTSVEIITPSKETVNLGPSAMTEDFFLEEHSGGIESTPSYSVNDSLSVQAHSGIDKSSISKTEDKPVISKEIEEADLQTEDFETIEALIKNNSISKSNNKPLDSPVLTKEDSCPFIEQISQEFKESKTETDEERVFEGSLTSLGPIDPEELVFKKQFMRKDKVVHPTDSGVEKVEMVNVLEDESSDDS